MGLILPKITEKEFTAQVIKLAKLFRWTVAHFRPAETKRGWRTPVQGDGAGFPDLIMVRDNRLVVAELKRSRKEKPTPEQEAWLEKFREAGAEVFVWRPEDWALIEETLR